MSMSTKKRQGKGNVGNNRKKNNNEDEPKLTESERLPLERSILDFISSGEVNLVMSGLSNTHRKFVHKYAARMGLKSFSKGSTTNRVLTLTVRNRNTLGDARKLVLSPTARRVLEEMMPNISTQFCNTTNQLEQQNMQNRVRLRSVALMFGLGPRMVPPLPNCISKELYQDKIELPIYQYHEDIHKMMEQQSIFIINGETGSGKTTQVPQYILNEATLKNRPCRILVSQPRRVAAVSVAHRVAEERGEPIGETVGYQIRMESRVRRTTNLIYTTSGCLLRSIMADVQELFRNVSHLIIDEIHERDKYTDFTLITVKEELKRNKDLKVILMSATMDINALSKYFDDCPVLNVPGQGFDVKIYHLEDILFHTGYRTALMEKYLRSMDDIDSSKQLQIPIPGQNFDEFSIAPVLLSDKYMQDVLDSILDQCCAYNGKIDGELSEMFDQIQYYIESEGMPVDIGHSKTGLTPLMAACKRNQPKYVQLFVERQANVHVRDGFNFAALDYAKLHEDGECVRILEISSSLLQQQRQKQQYSLEGAEKQRILAAYQRQFNEDFDVDHDLILSLLEGLYRRTHPGAIMVFLPGYNDIVMQRDLINSTLPAGTFRICILHGQMDSQDQFEALKVQRGRKIILSTNIGQTSITIPDLAYIIDSGKVKMKTYDSITESTQLQSVWISKADASQRSGRAGRTQNGVCYRLYSMEKYEFMPKFCIPEFMRIPLTEICLYAKTLDSDCSVQSYLARALHPPSPISVQTAVRKLQILEIFNDDESVTALGRHLVELPLDVQLGKCLLYGIFLKCFDPVLTIVAFHSVKDPFILPTDRAVQGQASFLRKSFAGQSFSDHMGILSLHKAYTAVRPNRRRARDFCNKHFLSQSAMEMYCATRRQIADLVSNKFRIGPQPTLFKGDWNMVRYCLVAGFYPNIAVIDRIKNTLISGAEKQLILQRTSALNPPGKKNLKEFVNQVPHDWIVFVEKSRVASMCSISMNTVVPSAVIALQCGRDYVVEMEDLSGASELSDDADDDSDDIAAAIRNDFYKSLKNLCISERKTILALDNWIKFEMTASDSKLLLPLRSLVKQQFLEFLQFGHNPRTVSVAYTLQKVLYSLHESKPLDVPNDP